MSLTPSRSPTVELPVVGSAILDIHYRKSTPPSDLTGAFFELDEMTLANPPRTVGQELLCRLDGPLRRNVLANSPANFYG